MQRELGLLEKKLSEDVDEFHYPTPLPRHGFWKVGERLVALFERGRWRLLCTPRGGGRGVAFGGAARNGLKPAGAT